MFGVYGVYRLMVGVYRLNWLEFIGQLVGVYRLMFGVYRLEFICLEFIG